MESWWTSNKLVPKLDIITVENNNDVEINDVEKVIGWMKKVFKSPEMLAKCWEKIVKNSKESNGGRTYPCHTTLHQNFVPSSLQIENDIGNTPRH